MANPRVKRIQNPTFNEVSLDGENPVLLKGELVCLLELDGTVKKFKLGDGFNHWSDLPFISGDEYPYTDLVTNQIGDVLIGTNQQGKRLIDIVKDMISPYVAPAVSNVKVKANGVDFFNTTIMEIGQSISAAIEISYDVNNHENLVATPVTVGTFGIFDETGNPYDLGNISILPNVALSPTDPVVYSIRLRVEHINGLSSWAYAYIRFDTRFIWGTSTLTDLTTESHALALKPSGGEGVKSTYKTDYSLTSSGYGYVLIPSILLSGQPAPVWTDVTDPNAPANIGMVNMGTLSVNNGVGIYNYEKFRTPFNNLSGIILRAS